MVGIDPTGLFPGSKMAQTIRLGQSQFYSAEGIASTDTNFVSVVLLAGWEGANGATTYSEEKNARAVTFASGARISTAQFKFGASCFDYNGGNCVLADNIDWKLSNANSDQFCIEMWLRSTTATPGAAAIIGQDFGAGDHAFYLATTATNELEFQADPIQTNYVQFAVTSGVTWAANTWYHIAVTKDATGNVRIFKDGVMMGSNTPANSIISNSAAQLNFGARLPLTPWPGFMDETRITKGAARYTANFTPPTVAFPRS